MRIGLIGAAALSGEHYCNLIEGIIDGSVDEIVVSDSNRNFKPEDNPLFSASYNIEHKKFADVAQKIQMLNHIYKNRKGVFPAFYEDYTEMLDAEKLDAVVIGTPQFLHVEMAVAALSKKIPTLCEKPLAVDLGGVDKILSAAKENDTLLQIGLEMRFIRIFEFLRKKIREDRMIGDIKMAWGREFRGDWKQIPATAPQEDNPYGNWRFSQKHTGGSVLEKLCHDLDMISWLMNAKPLRVSAFGGIDFYDGKGRDTIDNAVFIVEYDSGAKLSFEYCMAAPNPGRFKGRYMGFVGTEGMFDIDEGPGIIKYYSNELSNTGEAEYRDINPPTLPGHHSANSTLFAFRDFCERVKKGEKKAKHNPEDIRIITKLCMAIEESIRRNGEKIELASFDCK